MELNNLELTINKNIRKMIYNLYTTSRVSNNELIIIFKTVDDNLKLIYKLNENYVVLYYENENKIESCLLRLDLALSLYLKNIYKLKNLDNLKKVGDILIKNLKEE